ncbi:FMN-binding protein [Paenibacillus antri]|uniref:FMN-binding protein n=1 Tax=Paenibacillus antri TaxID=2582848 RepID=A0A5R9G893_9BACL|nr:FMN-binding protein [Paenibacillus antri]TLS51951.1 FMN-binding protein [Paenibacillus antri]
MKLRSWAIFTAITLLAGALTACGGGNAADPAEDAVQGSGGAAVEQPVEEPAPAEPAVEEAKYADGVYYAEAAEFAEKSGWKEIVGLKVEGGKIVSVTWNGLHRDGGLDKKTSSEEGLYGLVAKGGAIAEWHEQAAKAEQFLIETQDPAAIAVKDDGTTDAVSGVTVGVDEFVTLVTEALEAGPVEAGPYKDGSYHTEQAEFDANSGWKYMVHVTVLNGKIIAVNWNGVHKDGGDDKKTQSKNGVYAMVEKAGAQAEWHEQALKMEQYLLETQDPAKINLTDEEGHTDAVSGVSIKVGEFQRLVAEALEQAK